MQEPRASARGFCVRRGCGAMGSAGQKGEFSCQLTAEPMPEMQLSVEIGPRYVLTGEARMAKPEGCAKGGETWEGVGRWGLGWGLKAR